MKRFVVSSILALFCLCGNVWASEVKENGCISVEWGDTLWGIAKKLQLTVSDLAEKNGIKNPNRIYRGQEICQNGKAGDSKQGEKRQQKSVPIVSKPTIPVVQENGMTKSDGYTPYRNVGASPLVSEKDRNPKNLMFSERDALVLLGVTGKDFFHVISLVTSGQGRLITLKKGDRFVAMSEGAQSGKGIRISQNRIADWEGEKSAVRFDLADGRALVRIDQCYNWAILEQPIPEILEEKPVEDIAIAAVEPKPEEVSEKTNVCGLDDHELFVSRGGSIGNGSHTTYDYIDGFACLYKTRVEGGTVKVGAEGVAGNWHGSASDGFGYKGKRYGVGPAESYVDDDNWDARFGFVFGRFLNGGHSLDEDYRQARNFDMFGPTFGWNLYQREIAGEKLFPKTQVWASAFKLHATHVSHSWQGNTISDTGDLKSSWIISAGIRQFLYQGPIKPWISGEFFGELPMTRDVTAMIGITDEDEIFWPGIGKIWNLKKGGSAKSRMIGFDVGNAVRVIRSHARGEGWVNAGSSHYDPKTNDFVATPKNAGDVHAFSNVARFDIATGQFVSSQLTRSIGPAGKREEIVNSVFQPKPKDEGGAVGWNGK